MHLTLKDICKNLEGSPPHIEHSNIKKSRAEKRRGKRELDKSDKTFNMTAGSLNETIRLARDDERERVKKIVVSHYSAAVALVLHDKWGFGHKRLNRIVGQINDIFDSILRGYVDIEDIRKALEEETGVTF